jgi:hypothetical protein
VVTVVPRALEWMIVDWGPFTAHRAPAAVPSTRHSSGA